MRANATVGSSATTISNPATRRKQIERMAEFGWKNEARLGGHGSHTFLTAWPRGGAELVRAISTVQT